ncbi:type ISP restriction/modification enzyme [Rhizobium leguminosarum]|nr:type ISP restriction/modification enzyme [Rhizobium leguminosarum]
MQNLAAICQFPEGSVELVGESSLAELATRPDYAVVAHNALVGFIEVKAPGKGADPRRFSDPHDKAQWKKLRSLPNLLYTDGNAFSLWRDGELRGSVIYLQGDVEASGSSLSAPATLLPLIADFLSWRPIPPSNPKQLAEISARLCRFLRDEVVEQMSRGSSALTELAKDWRVLLFPQATDEEFADGYAQAVTFGLLVARAKNISLAGGIDHAAHELRKTDSLIGTALRLLTDDTANQDALKTSLGTLTRVLEEVNWSSLSKGHTDAWLYFYEDFLEVYDNALRKRTGSYYTPPEVVDAMVRLVDDALRSPELFDRRAGFASPDVIVADPAVGTGTFLLGILRKIEEVIEEDQGPGAVAEAISAAAHRLIGFEIQFGPFAVAQLRLLAEMHALTHSALVPGLRLFITDTLGNPYAEEERLPQILQPIGKSRRDANAVKRGEPITVVIGNPPYKEKAKGRGGWIEAGSDGRMAPMDRWSPPKEWGVGAHTKHLKNLYIYFWRWATWKVFGSGVAETTGETETDRAGIVCFITAAGFLNGPGFEKMRDDLRRDCTEIWVIDCSPEGHQPDVPTRIFEGVQQPLCIVLAARKPAKDRSLPARMRFYSLPEGKRDEKFRALAQVALNGPHWSDGPSGWRDPFLPVSRGAWSGYPLVEELFSYNGSGVMPGRTWVIAPDAETLAKRWKALTQQKDPEKREALFHPHQNGDKTSTKSSSKGLPGHEERLESVAKDSAPVIAPVRYAFRSLDRQWIIPDNRLLNRPNPTLWAAHSTRQVYLTCLEAHSPTSGPAISFSGQVPDLHHYKGSFGGRVFPLWRDAGASASNVKPAFTDYLSTALGVEVLPEDVLAYLAAVMAHPAFVERFSSDLVRPKLRVPITADVAVFKKALSIGEEVIWLHCYGERFANPLNGRPSGPPRLPKGQGPFVPLGGAIPGAPQALPDVMEYDPASKRLKIGGGFIDNVPERVWNYEISGKNVLRQWFSYRRLDRSKPIIGDRRPPSALDHIQPDHWIAEYTTDLLDLLHVVGRLVSLEERQGDLLNQVCDGPLLASETLAAAGALASVGTSGGHVATNSAQKDLFSM